MTDVYVCGEPFQVENLMKIRAETVIIDENKSQPRSSVARVKSFVEEKKYESALLFLA